MDYQKILQSIQRDIEPLKSEGQQADYIPALAAVNPDQWGICINTLDNKQYTLGDSAVPFSLQSITKVFALAMALSLEGDNLWTRMGKEPSGTAFNSLIQLELEKGKPRNPFINSGALVMADVLVERLPNPEAAFIGLARDLSGCPSIDYNFEVARSEHSVAYLNTAIANLLKYHGNIHGDIDRVLRFYFMMCSIEMNCQQLAHAFLAFADHRKPFDHAGFQLTSSQVKRMNAIMRTCGFYDEAGEFSYLVGLPGKSGVGGGIAAVFPGQYSVAVWSPRLNAKGNSVMGMKSLELLTTHSRQSIF